jgi:hypothetical protein
MSDPEITDNEDDEDMNTLMTAYNNIANVTNYDTSACNNILKQLKTSSEYDAQLTVLSDVYIEIINQYSEQFIEHKMQMAHSDFFNTASKNNNEDEVVDTEMIKNLANEVTVGGKTIQSMEVPKKNDIITRETNKINTNYQNNYRIGRSTGDWSTQAVSTSDIDYLEGALIGVQQDLSTMKVNIETDVDKLESCILQTTQEIDKMQVLNNKLSQRIHSIRNEAAGGEGKLYDAQLIYNQNYLGNSIIWFIICYLLYKSIYHYMANQKEINKTVTSSAAKLSDMITNSASVAKDTAYDNT